MEDKTYLVNLINILAADVLATQGARTSATMMLTQLNQDNSVPMSSVKVSASGKRGSEYTESLV